MTNHHQHAKITCKNCHHQFTGNYCNECSQAADTHRLTWKELLHHWTHAMWHVDGGLFYTIKQMFVRPGHAIQEYFDGKRIKHYNPFLFLLLTGGVFVFLYSYGHIELLNKQISIEKIENYNQTLAHKYYVIPSLIFLFLSTITDFLLYRSKKFTFPEILIFNTFCVAQLFVIGVLAAPILLLQHYIEMNFGMHIIVRPFILFAFVIYLCFARFQLMVEKDSIFGKLKVIFQMLALYLLYEWIINKLIALLPSS